MKNCFRLFIVFFLLVSLGASLVLYWFYIRTAPQSLLREEITITLVEGRTLGDYGQQFIKNNLVSSNEVWQNAVGLAAPLDLGNNNYVSARYLKLFPELLADKPKNASLEGYFFPETYRFFKDTSPRRIIEKVLSETEKRLTADLRTEIKRQHKTIFEILTMASLVEAEGQSVKDRGLIADILWRRLRVGMLLQVDSSVNYVTGKKDARLSARDVKLDSGYNTYKYKGLPPGPINNPGFDSIKASVYPTANHYWYFISGKDGQMHYARTLDEHNVNIARYLKK